MLSIQNIKIYRLLILLVIIVNINIFIVNNYIFVDELYYSSYSEILPIDLIKKNIELKNTYTWLSYIISPIIEIIKIYFAVFCLIIGSYIKFGKSNLKPITKIVFTSHFILLLYNALRTVFLFIFEFQNISEILNFFPLSLLSILNLTQELEYLRYPFAVLHIFELLFWFSISYLLKPITNFNFIKNFIFLMKTYGIGLFVWINLMIFITINSSVN